MAHVSGAALAAARLAPLAAWRWVILGSLSALAFTYRIGHEPLWLDEIYSFAIIQHGLVEIARHAAEDVHPPLYYWLLKAVSAVLGDSPVALRLLSVLGALGLFSLGPFPIRRIWGERAAVFYVLLLMTSPGVVCFAQEARMYTLTAWFVAGASLYGLLALNQGKPGDLLAFACFWLASGYTHHYGLLAAALASLWLLLLGIVRRKERRELPAFLITLIVVGLAFLPGAWVVLRQLTRVAREFWIPKTTLSLLTFGLIAPFTYKYEDIPYPLQALALFGIGVVVISLGIRRLARRGHSNASEALLYIALIPAFTLLVAVTFSVAIKPVYMPRYMLCATGLLLTAIAAGLAQLRGRVACVGAAAFVLLNAPALLRIYRETFNGPFKQVAAEVLRVDGASTLLLHNDMQTLFPAWHVLPQSKHVLILPPTATPWNVGGTVYQSESLAASNDVNSAARSAKALWSVDMVNSGYHASEALAERGWRISGQAKLYDLPWSWVKVRLTRYERP